MTALEQDPGGDPNYGHTNATFDALSTSGFFYQIGCSKWELADFMDDYVGHIDVWLTSKRTGETVGTSLRWQNDYIDMGTLTVRPTEYQAWAGGTLKCLYWIHCYGQHPDGNPRVAYTATVDDLMSQCRPTRWFYAAAASRARASRYVWDTHTWSRSSL